MSLEGLREGTEELGPAPLVQLMDTGALGGGPLNGGSCFHLGLSVGGGFEAVPDDEVGFDGGPKFL